MNNNMSSSSRVLTNINMNNMKSNRKSLSTHYQHQYTPPN